MANPSVLVASLEQRLRALLSKITAVPWRWGSGEPDFYTRSLVGQSIAGELLILRVEDECENKADAELIAAAPELLREAADALATQRQALAKLREALHVIHKTMRTDEHSECWTIRKWLDDRDIFNDDIQGKDRLVEECCKAALAASPDEGAR